MIVHSEFRDGNVPASHQQLRVLIEALGRLPAGVEKVWAKEVEPLLRSDVEGALKATTILGWLEERHPGRFSMTQLRPLQSRLRDWRALSGPDREVYFEQDHPPSREAQMDFTHCGELGVTVGGEPFGHLLFHFVLSHSGWRYLDLAYGETFAALIKDMQGALWELGVVRWPETSSAPSRTPTLGACDRPLRRTPSSPSRPEPVHRDQSRISPSLEAACGHSASERSPSGSCSRLCVLGHAAHAATPRSCPDLQTGDRRCSAYGSSFDAQRRLASSLGTLGDLRYLGTEFRDTPSSRAIPRIDLPSPFNSYSSFILPSLRILFGTSTSGFSLR